MDYQPNDIVQTEAGCSGDFFVITGTRPGLYPLAAVKLNGKLRGYKLSPEQIVRKVGVITVDDLVTMIPSVTNNEPVRQYLNTLKFGDPITLRIRGKNETCKFHSMVPRGTKYVFSAARDTGTVYRFPLAAVVLPED